MDWNTLAIVMQIILVIWFAFTHWIPLPPLNNLTKEAFSGEKQINLFMHTIQIVIISGFFLRIRQLILFGVVFWTIWFIGHIFSWWVPYFFGFPKVFLKDAVIDNAKTYHFLPSRGNHPIPDLNHCILGFLSLLTVIAVGIAAIEKILQ